MARREKKLLHACLAVEKSPLLSGIRQGFTVLIPVFMVGAISLIFQNLPVPSWAEWIENLWGGGLYEFFALIYAGTFGFASLYVLVAVCFQYARKYTDNPILLVLVCITAVASYLASLGVHDSGSILMEYFNVQSIFPALMTALVVCVVFRKSMAFLTKKNMFGKLSSDSEFRLALTAILPMVATVAIFALLSVILRMTTGYENYNALFKELATRPFEKIGHNIWSALLLIFLQTLLWFFGIHGSNVFENVNLAFFPQVQGEIFTKTFFDCFALIGGCGLGISLLVALLLFSKSMRHRAVCKGASITMLFNINEILIFGLPVVLNPVLLIPFLLAPLASTLLSYSAVAWGLVPMTVRSVSWTTPVFVSGYLATGSVAGIALQLVNILAGVAIYAPFVKMANRVAVMRRQESIQEMEALVKCREQDGKAQLRLKSGVYADLAKELAIQLGQMLEKREITLFYQPQHDSSGKVVSCEALFRWRAGTGQFLYPPMVFAIARENGLDAELHRIIAEQVLADAKKIKGIFRRRIKISMNLPANYLENPAFMQELVEKAGKMELNHGCFGIEITEEAALVDSEDTLRSIEQLAENHIAVYMDDFSMGHTSLKCLQKCTFNYVKLDGELVRDMTKNIRSRDIIQSIIRLGETLNFEVIAEYVEREEQKKELESMGCHLFQGYLYSPAISFDELVDYLTAHGEPRWDSPHIPRN